ncbi:MAG: APC family permease, partial [Gemmataceae bacterium]
MGDTTQPAGLHRHFGLLQATALNVTMIVGAGVFATIPFMLKELPGWYALLGWVAGAGLMLVDGLIWSELGATLPGSGGTYVYLLESYGRNKWGRPMAFLFIWQFLLSGPLELASGLIAIATFAPSLSPQFAEFNANHTLGGSIDFAADLKLGLSIGPAKLLALALGVVIVLLLYRRITTLGQLTVALWIGVLGILTWVLVEGSLHLDLQRVFDTPADRPTGLDFARKLGTVTLLAMYSYLGYYNVCYIGDEVKEP